MAETRNAYEITTDWQSLSLLTGFSVGSELILQNVGMPGDIIEIAESELEPSLDFKGHNLDQLKSFYKLPAELGNIWVRFRRADKGDAHNRRGLLQVNDVNDVAPYVVTDIPVRYYQSLSSGRVLTTGITQSEIATIEGGRFNFVKSFDNFDTNTPLYILIENPTGSGVNVAFQKRALKTYTGGVIRFQVFWDYDVTGATKTPIPAFNENNAFRTLNPSKVEVSVLNPVTAPANGEWTINGSYTPVAEGIEREIDFIATIGKGSNSTGDISPDVGFRLYVPSTGALVKIVSDTNDNRVILGYDWVEAPVDL